MAATELSNAAIADALEELGDLYELDGAIVHRVLAYRTGAKSVRGATSSVAALARAGRATELPGIGATLQEKILALLDTGTIPAAAKLREKFPAGLLRITRLSGIGPKRARLLFSELGVDSPEALREAALAQRVRSVRGLGPKFEERIVQALAEGVAERPGTPRMLLPQALELGEEIATSLRDRADERTTVMLAGSARRQTDSVKDLDLIATTTRPTTLAKSLAAVGHMQEVSSAGRAGARGVTYTGMAVDLRIAKPAALGNLLAHMTGSGEHNAALRERAQRSGLSVSEYGVLDQTIGRTRTCASEAELYELLGLSFIEPELRENRGELDAARRDGGSGLPELIELADIRGDLHAHTVASDGHNTIDEMAAAALARGYEFLAITDHSASHGFGNDVSPAQLRRQIELVREANARINGVELLAGSEVNVFPDGSLDYDDELLSELDWVIASVHTSFGIGEQAMTERVLAAIEHPLVDAIGHPTGRLIERRAPYELDLEAVFAAAARTGTLLEINANPARRDLSDAHARAARGAGVRLVINSDAHRTRTLENMRWGVATARRAWLTREDVFNTRPWRELQELRKRSARREARK
jgi:DNA polymerase (family 10)